MLSVNLGDGDYLTIGDDIVVQVVSNAIITLYVTAPKDMAILRGKVREQQGKERPACLFNTKEMKKKPKRKKRASTEASAKSSEAAGRKGMPK